MNDLLDKIKVSIDKVIKENSKEKYENIFKGELYRLNNYKKLII